MTNEILCLADKPNPGKEKKGGNKASTS